MKKVVAFYLLLLTAGITPANAQVAPFKNGDKIAFVGNSITEQGYYESYIWLYYMLHFPGKRIIILNRGIGGDRAEEIYKRFDDDVVASDPDVIVLTFGMNDSGYFEYLKGNADSVARVHVADSRHYFDLIREKLKKLPNVKKVIILGSPFDETVKLKSAVFPGKVQAMEQIAAFQTKAAKENHWGLVDFLHPMTAIDLREQKEDSTFTLTGNDRIHPGNSGHFVMAWLFLKAQGLANLPVADIAIDVKSGKLDRAENCKITGLDATDTKSVHFDYLASSLPLPVDTVPRLWGNPHRQSEALPVMPFYTEFDREMLRVSNLTSGNYELTIDGREIAQFTANELGEGVNLAKLPNTPEYEQAMSVLQLNEERMGLESKLRQYYWLQYDYLRGIGRKFNDDLATMDSVNTRAAKDWAVNSKRDSYRAGRYPAVRAAWRKEMKMLVDDIYTINQPKTHRIEIKKVAR
ncbi:MAG TPA: SGNH/GDSL hydrolase family protein [Puia sp.]|nr:SGNH/GDSL hydrolase family protein [Puia sp.]